MNITQADIDRLERYVELLQEVIDLKDDIAECLEVVKELQTFTIPTAGQMQAVSEHLEKLERIEELADV